jgi:predicted negative regulator of RcsB-dependent stress response
LGNWALGDAELALGHKPEARVAYKAALESLDRFDPVRAATSIKQLRQAVDNLNE